MPPRSHTEDKRIHTCSVISNKNVVGEIYLMRLVCPEIARAATPGQFVNLKVNDELIPLLRKPFSVCRRHAEEGWFEVLWKVVGKGTLAMVGFRDGDSVSVIGPLGNGFRIAPDLRTAFVVAGGIGVAPFPFLTEELLVQDRNVEVFLGGQCKQDLAMVDFFNEAGVPINITTEDGSVGRRGLVTESLQERLDSWQDSQGAELFSCGPTGLLQAMMGFSETYHIHGQLAMETMMGCGFGICVGCPVRVRNPLPGQNLYKLTCIDGPVFDAEEICLDA